MKGLLSRILVAGAVIALGLTVHAQTRPVPDFGPVKITPI